MPGRMKSEVYTLEDLKQWDRPGTWLAVLGFPVKHSLSPAMHNAALRDMAQADARFEDWNYTRFEIAVEDLGEALELLHQHHFLGVNLTIPHKVEVFKYARPETAAVESMGAMNTLIWSEAGYVGTNTDGYGLEQAISERLDISLSEKLVLLLGAGGASRAAAVQCLERGCPELWIGNRSQERLEALVDDVTALYPERKIYGFLFSHLPYKLPRDALIIQGTASGLKSGDATPISFEGFEETSVLFDMIYSPPQTVAMEAAQRRGMRVANGLDMLVHQGAKALEIWSESAVPVATMRNALLESQA